MHAASAIDGLDLEGDELTGARAVRAALDAPLARIAENAGLEGRVVVSKVRELGAGSGLNAATGEYGDLAKQGVIDPVKVTKAALGNAASIAAMVLTTDSAVVEKPAEEEHEPRRRAPHPRPLARRARPQPLRLPRSPHGAAQLDASRTPAVSQVQEHERGRVRISPDPPSSACGGVRLTTPAATAAGLRGDQPGPLLLAHAAPDPVGLADRERVLRGRRR